MNTMSKVEINIVVDENGECNFSIPSLPPIVFMDIWSTVMRAYVDNAVKPATGSLIVPKEAGIVKV